MRYPGRELVRGMVAQLEHGRWRERSWELPVVARTQEAFKIARQASAWLVLLWCLGGCATLTGGTSQTISINSNVSGATVFIEGRPVGRTPFVGKVDRESELLIQLQKPGYLPQSLILTGSFRPIFFGNIILGGTTGSSTDLSTGAMYEYSPASYYVNFEPAHSGRLHDHEADTALKRFVMVNYEQLSSDIVRGQGARHAALLGHFVHAGIDEEMAAAELLSLWVSVQGAVEFGEAVSDYYLAQRRG